MIRGTTGNVPGIQGGEYEVFKLENQIQIHDLKPGMKPEATFKTTEMVIAAYEYCNLHGLWKAE